MSTSTAQRSGTVECGYEEDGVLQHHEAPRSATAVHNRELDHLCTSFSIEAPVLITYRSSRIRVALPTTVVLFTGNQHPQPRRSSRYQNKSSNSDPAIAIAIENNKKIVALGKTGQWENLLEFAAKEFSSFNNVNCATLMSQLGRIRSFDKSDPRFLVFLQELAERIKDRGLPWIQAQGSCEHHPRDWEDEVEEFEHN